MQLKQADDFSRISPWQKGLTMMSCKMCGFVNSTLSNLDYKVHLINYVYHICHIMMSSGSCDKAACSEIGAAI